MQTRIAHSPDTLDVACAQEASFVGAHGVVQAPASSAPLLFVTGASRSGTTMLARMLGSHSAIMAFNEMHYFGAECDPYANDREISALKLTDLAATLLVRQTHGLWGGRPSDVERAWAGQLVHDLADHERTPAGLFAAVLRRLADDAGKSIACEQTPRNIFYAKQLLDLYPNARIIHIVRDPRAVLASQKNRWQLKRLGAHHLPLSEMIRNRVNYHPYTMGKLWAKATDGALALAEHPRFLMVRFEDLAADAKGNVSRLCSFLGLQFEPAMLDIPRWGSSNLESSEQTGVSSEVVNKWRESLSRGELRICERTTQRLMQRLKYTPEFLGQENAMSSLPSLISYPLHVVGVVALNPVRAWIHVKALFRRNHVSGNKSKVGSAPV